MANFLWLNIYKSLIKNIEVIIIDLLYGVQLLSQFNKYMCMDMIWKKLLKEMVWDMELEDCFEGWFIIMNWIFYAFFWSVCQSLKGLNANFLI